jgi:hypothetical protein
MGDLLRYFSDGCFGDIPELWLEEQQLSDAARIREKDCCVD